MSFHEVAGNFLSGSRSKNISEAGLCILLTHIPDGSFLELEIKSGAFKASVKAIARIAWIASRNEGKFPFEAGLEFVNLGPVERNTLHDFIDHSAAQGGTKEIHWID